MVKLPGLLFLALAALAAHAPARAGMAEELAARVVSSGLNPAECYRVRELNFSKEDLRFYLGEGYLIFSNQVNGGPLIAAFTAEGVEGGDAEVMLFPPTRAERMSLASYTGSPNLDEHFKSAVFLFTDGTQNHLMEQIRSREQKKAAEMGAVLKQQWDPVIRNFLSSFQVRLVRDLLAGDGAQRGFFYGALGGGKLGNFDVIYDAVAREQITAGQLVYPQEGTFFNVWTRFAGRDSRSRRAELPREDYSLANFRIDAALDPGLKLTASTSATLTATREIQRVLSFDISPRMHVSAARVDGQPAEVFQPDSVRSNLIRGGGNNRFLVVPPSPLKPGEPHEIVLEHEGEVIADAGNKVYYVGARGSWYPNFWQQFARYDLTFRYPKELTLVATGEVVSDRTEGPWRITRRRTDSQVRMAGFNLGDYERESVSKGGFTVQAYANRRLERALEPPRDYAIPVPAIPHPGKIKTEPPPLILPPPNPAARLQQLASEVASALEFFSSSFGPPPLKTLTVSPIPGFFGQGFPGLVYLSTVSYLEPERRPGVVRSGYQQTFYSEILQAHETAHQWWGNLVVSASPEDDWLMEALADYSALMYVERRKGKAVLDSVLNKYREDLLAKKEGGGTLESAGPITWGYRLLSSSAPDAWRTITYDKGAWIMHMLRRRMGDERFLRMLGELRRNYEYRGISTADFRAVAAGFMPPDSPDPKLDAFFEQWVYGTGIPSLKLSNTVRGKAGQLRVAVTLTQSDVDEDFSAWVPVEIQFARAKPVVHWVRSSSEGASFSAAVPQRPVKVLLDPAGSVLKR